MNQLDCYCQQLSYFINWIVITKLIDKSKRIILFLLTFVTYNKCFYTYKYYLRGMKNKKLLIEFVVTNNDSFHE